MDPLIIVLIVVISILTILLVVVGVHVVQILSEVRKSIQKFNNTVDTADAFIHRLHSPFQHKGGVIEGVKVGLQVADSFVHWLKKAEENE